MCACVSTFSNIFSFETTGPIEDFHVEPSWDGGTKVCSNGPGHMTKLAAMPIYGKNLQKSSSPEPLTLKTGKQKSPGRATSRGRSQSLTPGGREKVEQINVCIANKQMHDKHKDQLPLPQARWSKC